MRKHTLRIHFIISFKFQAKNLAKCLMKKSAPDPFKMETKYVFLEIVYDIPRTRYIITIWNNEKLKSHAIPWIKSQIVRNVILCIMSFLVLHQHLDEMIFNRNQRNHKIKKSLVLIPFQTTCFVSIRNKSKWIYLDSIFRFVLSINDSQITWCQKLTNWNLVN